MQSYNKHKNIAQAAKDNGVDESTAALWVDRFLTTGDVIEKKSPGRKRSMSTPVCAHARSLLLSGSYTASQVARQLEESGQTAGPLNETTICRNAKRYSRLIGKPIRAVRGKPQQELSMETMRKRLEFCQSHVNFDWSTVMFTDRKRFLHKYRGSHLSRVTWAEQGERRKARSVNHAQCVNVYLGLTPQGLTPLHFVTGTSKHSSKYMRGKKPARSITISEYEDVLVNTLLPAGEILFPESMPSFILQQDNDPCHKKGSDQGCETWNAEGHIHTVNILQGYPPSSPDFNIIENVWGMLQCEMDAHVYNDIDEYKAGLVQACKDFPHEKIVALYESMPNRMQQGIKKKGGRTKY